MKVYSSEQIRNLGLVGHQGVGKTTLAENMLFDAEIINRAGKIEDGNTVSDYLPEEHKRAISINTTFLACPWKDIKLNILDVPGFSDFVGEVEGSLRVADTLIMMLDAVSGVEVSSEIIWDMADKKKQPIIAFVNKMDRENANFSKVLDNMDEVLTRYHVPLQIPIGSEESFKGIVDLLQNKAFEYEDGKAKEVPIPDDMQNDVDIYRETLIEAAAEGNDDLTMKYLEGEELTQDEIILGLKEGILKAKIVPVLCGSAIKNIAIDKLMNVLVNFAPSPVEKMNPEWRANKTALLVFKTLADAFIGKISLFKVVEGSLKENQNLHNLDKNSDEKLGNLFVLQGKEQVRVPELAWGDIGALTKLDKTLTNDTLTEKDNNIELEKIKFSKPTLNMAIEPKSKGDEDKLGNALSKLLEEDTTLKFKKEAETNQNVIRGMGENHIKIAIDRLKNRFDVEVEVIPLLVPYRETVRGNAKRVEGKHKKQSGGHGQYGHVYIDIEPAPGEDLIFEEEIFGGSVPKQYIPAVEKGIIESMEKGELAGYKVTGIKVTLLDGSYHDVDSSEMAFKIAANLAFRRAFREATPILLEPFMDVEILVPDEYMGDIMSDMNTKRGRILGMEQVDNLQKIKAQAPLSEMNNYAIDLKSITQGRGKFTMGFSGYEEVPAEIAEKIIVNANGGETVE